MAYQHLLSPASIGNMALKNRMVLAAMGSNFCEEDGHCNERLIRYYEERAKGGAGLIILETSAAAWPSGATMPRTVGFSSDDFLPGLTELATRVHQHGAKIAAQINHGGKIAQEDTAAGRNVLIPSPLVKSGSEMFQVLTPSEIGHFIKAAGPDGKGPRYKIMEQQDIDWVVEAFASAADRAKRAGFDAIQVHAGHGYLISSFLSPATNKRDDQYGGSAENRARLLVEIVTAIRQRVGAEMPILVRLDAKEYRVEGGIEPADAAITTKLVEQAGADAIDVSAYGNAAKAIAFTEAPLVHQPAGFVDFARTIKEVVSVPVIAVGRLEPDVADKCIGKGYFDFMAMGRKLLADPMLPNKLAEGKPETIRPCIYCYVCVSQIFINQPMCCAVNPATGNEYQVDLIARSGAPKKVLVIGAGPGGMEAARTLAERGHQVHLWEQSQDLGGTARVAALAYEPNGRLIRYLSNEIRQHSNIELTLNQTATADNIKALAPDHVIVATGALRQAPDFAGKEQRHVFDGDQMRGLLFGTDPEAAKKLNLFQRIMVTAGRVSQLMRNIDALRFLSKLWMPIASDVVIIGGGLVGLELAEYLIERGRKVIVLEPSASLGAELSIVRRARVIHQLREHGAELVTQVEIDRIGEKGVHYRIDGEVKTASGKQVIIAMGATANNTLAEQISATGFTVSQVGDCREVGYIEGAIRDARAIAQTI